ncbi:neprosin family prolyl endopeptidase [Angustibacter sp. McL0619]|uniref:neprosin family prolyl endopeptidase n=1 Tax=Angustibacter sp. McL0619 TaxID=3415676 RepID=UPI003CE8B939
MRQRPLRRHVLAALAAAGLLLGIVPTAAADAPSGRSGAAAPARVSVPPGSVVVGRGRVASASASAAAAADGTVCNFGACYDYVAGRQYADASGAAVKLKIVRPELDPADLSSHSLHELAVESADGSQIVEVGWTADRGLNGDATPHLFVYHWVDGQPTCYNGCGFVSTSSTVRPAMTLPVGTQRTFQINHVGTQWRLALNGKVFGYFPDSLWGGRFSRLGLVQAFGEVASTTAPTCSDMGNGQFGKSASASLISGFKLLNSTTPVAFSMLATTPRLYSAANITSTSFRLGGPGSGRCAAA